MRTRAPIRRSRSARSTKRRTAWADSRGFVTLTAGTGLQVVDLLAGFRSAGGDVAGCTIGAVWFECNPVVATVAQVNSGVISHGLRIDDNQETASSMPNPESVPYIDWMLNRSIPYNAGVLSAPAFADATTDTHLLLRSKRKLHQLDDTLWSVWSLPAANAHASTGTLEIHWQARTLLLLA